MLSEVEATAKLASGELAAVDVKECQGWCEYTSRPLDLAEVCRGCVLWCGHAEEATDQS